MRIKYLPILIATIFILVMLYGCSGPALNNGSTKDPNAPSTDTPKHTTEAVDDDFNPDWAPEVDFYFISLSSIVQTAANYYIQSHEPAEFITVDYGSLVREGYLAIIPQNIYNKADVKQSKVYSPGDLYYYWDILDGGEFIIHFGEGASRYNPQMHAKGEVREQRERFTNYLSESWDGLSEIIFAPGRDSKGNIDPKQTGGYIWKNPQVLKMYQMYLQLSGLFFHRSEHFDMPADDLDGMIGVLGRKNPECWINPYSGEIMKEVPLYVPEYFSFYDEQGPFGVPEDMIVEMPDIHEYAGNYSYVSYNNGNNKTGALVFYYINENKDIDTFTCPAVDRNTALNG